MVEHRSLLLLWSLRRRISGLGGLSQERVGCSPPYLFQVLGALPLQPGFPIRVFFSSDSSISQGQLKMTCWAVGREFLVSFQWGHCLREALG